MKKSYNKGEKNPRYKGANSNNRLGKTNICLTCGKEYIPKEFRESRPPKYCSIRCSKIGRANPNYKEVVGYGGLHDRMHKLLDRPTNCQKCGKECKPDLANKSGEYKSDVTDWVWLCRKCHMDMDGITDRLIEFSTRNRKYGEIECKHCGNTFTQKFKKQSFCSKPCSTTFYNLNVRIYEKRRNSA